MCQKDKVFIRVTKDLTFEQIESGYQFHGYKPHFLVNGTWSVLIDDLPFKPGEQWTELVPPEHEFYNVYNLVFDQDLGGYNEDGSPIHPEIAGLTLKTGAFLKLTYYILVDKSLLNL